MNDFPVGFRFFPNEEELVSFYLLNKLNGTRSSEIDTVIPVVNIYDYNPSDLPQLAGKGCPEDTEQWFFFTPRQESEARGGRINRLTQRGFWKATGSPGGVYSSQNYRIIGRKNTMVFYEGRAPNGTKTNWKMNEYKAFDRDYDPPFSVYANYQTIRRAIVIGNGIAGAENQCIGLVRALGLSGNYTLHRVSRPRGGINERLHWLPISVHKQLDRVINWNREKPFQAKKLMPLPAEGRNVSEANARHIAKLAHDTFDRDGPILVVASGRDTISVASAVKRLVPENVFLVQIQHPRSRLHRFDLVITPDHDYYPLTPEAQQQIPFLLRRWVTPRKPPDKHVVLTVGALHRADSASLKSAASAWHDEMAVLPKPLLVVSTGGPTRHCRYGADLAMQLAASLKSVLPSCGSVRISFSRRTPKIISDVVLRELSHHHKVYIWNGEDPNPHMGHLAWADAFVITADSVSMLSEACSTGKPVYVIGAERCTWKFSHFLKSLQRIGAVRRFTGSENISEKWEYPPLCDAKKAADEVIKALAERGWKLLPP